MQPRGLARAQSRCGFEPHSLLRVAQLSADQLQVRYLTVLSRLSTRLLKWVTNKWAMWSSLHLPWRCLHPHSLQFMHASKKGGISKNCRHVSYLGPPQWLGVYSCIVSLHQQKKRTAARQPSYTSLALLAAVPSYTSPWDPLSL
jgi:hypothetical protein